MKKILLFLPVLIILSLKKRDVLIPSKGGLTGNLDYILRPEGFGDLIEYIFSLPGTELSISYNYKDVNEHPLILNGEKAFYEQITITLKSEPTSGVSED